MKSTRITTTIRLNKEFVEWLQKNNESPTEVINNSLAKTINLGNSDSRTEEEKTYFYHYLKWKEQALIVKKEIQELQILSDIVRSRAKKIVEKADGKNLFPEIVEGYNL